jgi:phospholipase C
MKNADEVEEVATMHCNARIFACSLAVAIALGGAGCAGRSSALPPGASDSAPSIRSLLATNPIKHIVIIIQENRSFDNYFSGYPGADSATSGKTHKGDAVKLLPTSYAAVGLNHTWEPGLTDWDHGKMDGFDLEKPIQRIPSNPPRPLYAYGYIQRPLVKPYWDMAQQYVLGDRMFADEFGASFTGHQLLFAGTTKINATEALVDLPTAEPWDCDAPKGTVTSLVNDKREYLGGQGPFPCLSYSTIADVLDPAHITWKYYTPAVPGGLFLWNAPAAIKKIRYGPDNANIITTEKQILADAQDGKLPNVSWVIPDFVNSDHTAAGSPTGPSWVAAVVNAVGKGPDWNSSAIVVVWDDWGGWYDHVAPPQLDYLGLGERVPLLIIGPYARKGYVDHTQYEFASTLKFIEQVFGLPTIGNYDVRSNGMLDAFDFQQKPRAFVPIPAPYSFSFFKKQKESGQPVDDE